MVSFQSHGVTLWISFKIQKDIAFTNETKLFFYYRAGCFIFYAPLRVIINLINPQNSVISDLSAHNVNFQSRLLLLIPAITFHSRFGAEKLLLSPETEVKSNCGGEKFGGFSLAVFFCI